MSLEVYLQLGLNGLTAVIILALVALGLAIIFGFMGVVNLAHGSFLMLGAYTVWVFATVLDVGFWVGLVVAPFVVASIGYIVEKLIVSRLYNRLLDTILATWGVALVLQEIVSSAVGSRNRLVETPLGGSVDLLIVSYPTYRLFIIVFGSAVLVGIFILFYRTHYGIRLRAVIQDDDTASTLGINKRRTYSLTFALGSGLAGLAGAVVAPITPVNPTMGISYLVQSFFAVILGGMGTLLGIIPGSVVVAGLTNTMSFFIQPRVGETLVFVIVITLIILRPQGLLGRQL